MRNPEKLVVGIIIYGIIWHPLRSHEVHLISLFQIEDNTEATGSITTIVGNNYKLTILHEVSSHYLVSTEEACAELVGSVLRGDKFTIIVNVAASDIGDDLVELNDFLFSKCCIFR